MGNFLFRGWACLSLWGAITGCSGSPADSGKVGNKPRTSEEALARLSSTQQRSFEDWKQKLIKACDAGTIFGIAGSSAEEVGIDGAVLLRQNSGSVVFSDVDQYAILTDAQSFSGTRETHVEETREVNGERNQLAAATEQKGSHCIVSLWGQKIHEVEIAQNMTIGMHWMTKRPVQAVAEIPELKSLGSSTPVSTMMGEVPSRGLDQLLSGVFQPTEAAWGFLAQRLGVPLEQIEKVFKLRSDSSNLAIRGVNAPGLWNLSYNGKFQSSMASLQEMFASPMGTLSLEVRVPIPNFQWGNARNTADSGNLKIVLDVSGVKKVNSFEYFLRNLGNRGWVAWDLPEALQCAKERAVAYGKDGLSSRRIQPSVEGMLGPCRILHAEVEKASYETGLLKSLLPARFEGVSPGAGVQYGGWDGVLAKLALEVLAQGRDIRQELDPQRQTKIMGPVASHLESLQRELLSTRNLDSWRESLLRMGLDWAFQGQEVLPARVQLILSSLDRTAVPFQVSARSLLEDLRRWPADQEETLQFAQKVDSNYLSEAQRALKFAQEIRYSYFESNIFNKILQRRVPLTELQENAYQFKALQDLLRKYDQVGPVQEGLVNLSLKYWRSNEATLPDLEVLYATVVGLIVPFRESTQIWLTEVSQSYSARAEVLRWAPSVTDEYRQLAREVRDQALAAEESEWSQSFFKSILQKRPDLSQLRNWKETWTAAASFVAREKSRAGEEWGFERNRKKILEVALQENWKAGDFDALEKIAPIARFKSICESLRSASSLAECGGLNLFSQKQNQFLDPNFQRRYVELASEWEQILSLLGGFEFFGVRRDGVEEFFGQSSFQSSPLWSRCDASAFGNKRATFKGLIQNLTQEKEALKKWELERQVREVLKNC